MKKLMMMATVALAVAFGATDTKAEEDGWNWSPLGVGIAAPVQLPWTSSSVYGLRLGSFFGNNVDVYGIDWTLVGMTTGEMIGLQATAFSWSGGDVYGIQAGVLANVTYEDVYGLQLGFANVNYGENAYGLEIGAVNYGVSSKGLQFGAIMNWNTSVSGGFQLAPINADQEDYDGASIGFINFANRLSGCQIGAFNSTDDGTGLQLGVVNAAGTLRGVQIGLINLICDAKVLPIMLIANAQF